MKVHELITALQDMPRSATVYAMTADHDTGAPVLVAIAGIDPAASPVFGAAVIIEMED